VMTIPVGKITATVQNIPKRVETNEISIKIKRSCASGV
jgi:hypothetical protein